MNNKLSNIIINKRKQMKISRRELARRIEVDQAYLSRIEKDEIDKPSVKILFNLCKELNLSFIDLLFKCYNYIEIETLGVFNNINEIFSFVDDSIIKTVTIVDKNGNDKISLKKTLDLFKDNKIDIKNTIGLLSCITNKYLIDYLTKEEIMEIEKK